MRRKGNCWDNAVAESFFGSLKKERIKKQIYKNQELALNDVADYIDHFYNRTLRHSHLGGVSLGQLEAAQKCGEGVSTKSWELQFESSMRQSPDCSMNRQSSITNHQWTPVAAHAPLGLLDVSGDAQSLRDDGQGRVHRG